MPFVGEPRLRFGAGFEHKPPATKAEIHLAEKHLNVVLPKSYQEFLLSSNGGEGAVGVAGYLTLWPLEQLSSLRNACGFPEFAPQMLPLGSNGASECFAIRFHDGEAVFGFIPFADLSDDAFIEIDRDFWKALSAIGEGKVFD